MDRMRRLTSELQQVYQRPTGHPARRPQRRSGRRRGPRTPGATGDEDVIDAEFDRS